MSARRPRPLAALLALTAVAAVAASPATYDQRQDGEFNVRADVQNVVLLAVLPHRGGGGGEDLLQLLGGLKSAERRGGGGGGETEAEATVGVLEAFAEPGSPYRVEIAGEAEPLELLGAREQCGPGRSRDRAGVCRVAPQPAATSISTAAASTASATAASATAASAAAKLAPPPVRPVSADE